MSTNKDQINRRRPVSQSDAQAIAQPGSERVWFASTLAVAVVVLSMFYANIANAEKHSDQLANAAHRFSQAVSTLGDRDGPVAERASSLNTASRNLASQGESGFGGDKYRDTFKRVKSLVADIGGMELEPVDVVVDAWRQIRSSVEAIDQKLAKGGGVQHTGSSKSPKNKTMTGGNYEPSQISGAKNGANTGKHVDQVEDLSERVKNSFRAMLKKRRKMANKEWAGRLDGQLSSFDQNANKLRDSYKSGANWKPVLAAMKRQAQRVDRFMQKDSLSGPVSKQWRQLKAHLEQI